MRESVKVKTFLYDELNFDSSPFDRLYGDIHTLDADTARLCEWCRTHDVTKASLELQIWWRDHQKADRKREEIEQRKKLPLCNCTFADGCQGPFGDERCAKDEDY